jgi:threonine/homoserine/homoserine lactone efflux protein
MKKFYAMLQAAAVMAGNLLQFRLVSWKEANEQAVEMTAAKAAWTPDPTNTVVDSFGTPINNARPQGPFEYFFGHALNLFSIGVLAWAVVKLIAAVSGVVFSIVVYIGAFLLMDYLFRYMGWNVFPREEDKTKQPAGPVSSIDPTPAV